MKADSEEPSDALSACKRCDSLTPPATLTPGVDTSPRSKQGERGGGRDPERGFHHSTGGIGRWAPRVHGAGSDAK